MSQTTNRLTAMEIKSLTQPGRYADGGNLYLRVGGPDAKSWAFVYRDRDGKQAEVGGGSANDVSLVQARAWAKEGRAMLAETPPRDPKTEWRIVRNTSSVPTFGEMTAQWLEGKNFQPPYRRKIEGALRLHCARLADLRVHEITTAILLEVLKPLHAAAPRMAHDVRTWIFRILAGAQALNFIEADRRNPAEWRGRLDQLLPKLPKSRHLAAWDYRELPALMQDLRTQRYDQRGVRPHILGLEFCILTGARSKEVRFAVWDEIDFKERLWSIPGARMKGGLSHTVPLSGGAMEILKIMHSVRRNNLVFPGRIDNKPMGVSSMCLLFQKMTGTKATVHGTRPRSSPQHGP
jgi:integrase